MRIEVDTSKDSPEDIQKVVHLLQALSGRKAFTNFEIRKNEPINIFENPLPSNPYPTTPQPVFPQPDLQPSNSQPSAFGAMFDNMDKDSTKESEPKKEEPGSFDLEVY